MSDASWEVVLPPLFARAGIALDGPIHIEALTGGVSSDIVRVSLSGGRDFCAKRALPKLKVASDWQAPLDRNHFEIAWLQKAGEIALNDFRAGAWGRITLEAPDEFMQWYAAGEARDAERSAKRTERSRRSGEPQAAPPAAGSRGQA